MLNGNTEVALFRIEHGQSLGHLVAARLAGMDLTSLLRRGTTSWTANGNDALEGKSLLRCSMMPSTQTL
jgi:hypothetical protein